MVKYPTSKPPAMAPLSIPTYDGQPTRCARTGCFTNHVLAAIGQRAGVMASLADPSFAGYCLDAPSFMPAGSSAHSRGDLTLVNRDA